MHRSQPWAVTACEEIEISPYNFYPDRPVHVQVSVNHVNYSDAAYVHEAVVAWVENIRETNFTVCVTHAGRNEKKSNYVATVDWLAYQGAPDGGVSGNIDMPTWWSGTSCQSVNLPSVSLVMCYTLHASHTGFLLLKSQNYSQLRLKKKVKNKKIFIFFLYFVFLVLDCFEL